MIIVLANLISLFVLLVFILQRYKINKSLIEPGIIFTVNLGILYPTRGLFLYFFGDDALPDYPGIVIEDNLQFISLISLLGIFGYVLGYQVVLGRRKLNVLSIKNRIIQPDDLRVCYVLFIGAILGISYKIATGDYMSYLISETRVSGLTQIGNILTALQWPTLIGVWALWFKGNRSKAFIILFAISNLIFIPYQFVQGSKTFLSLILVSIVLAFYWTKKSLPKLSVIASVLIVVLFVFPFVHNFREYVNHEFGYIPSLSRIDFNKVMNYENDSNDEDSSTFGRIAKVSARYGGIDHLYGITETVPAILPYNFGFNYTAVFVNIVPRAIWPSKPIYSRGADYGASLGTVTSVTPFPFGEAYWDLGTSGLFVMMFVWGAVLAALLRMVNSLFNRPNLNFLIGVYFLSQLYWMAGAETSMPSVVSGLPQQYVLIVSLVFVMRIIKKINRKY